jgi:hypothetical protein
VQCNNAEDETQAENQDDDGIDLEAGGLVGVELCTLPSATSSTVPNTGE